MSDAVKRLHITPLDAAILDTVLQPSIRHLATDISFHTIETHPENNYGFVTLPKAEAEKVTKKLNGAILKGKKFRIEQARPVPTTQPPVESGANTRSTPVGSSVSLKRKAIDHIIEGYELPSSRKVMRGWTEPRASSGRSKKKGEESKKSRKQPSKYSNSSECLFRTVPPANKSTKTKPSKKRDGTESVTVHEFKKTVKHPSFVKAGEEVAPSKLTGEYVEGKGWVDREGNVKEQPPKKSERPLVQPSTKKAKQEPKPKLDGKKDATAGSPAAGDESESSEAESPSSEDYTSSEGSDDSSDSDSDDESSSTGTSSSSEASESEKSEAVEQETPAPTVEDTPKVHPLEALFKRPKPSEISIPNPQLTIDTQFSFFGNADDSGSDVETHDRGYTEPQTPFTVQDLQSRSMRSLAPTPDTALPTKITFWGEDSNVNDLRDDNNELDTASGDGELPSSPTKPGAKRGKEAAEESEFAQWFWENRGDNNRAWKRRRREAGKEKRQRENRSARGRR